MKLSPLWTIWEATVRRHGRRTAMWNGTDRVTFSLLHALALDMAENDLRHTGPRLAVALNNGFSWMALFLASQRNGTTFIPLDPAQPEESLKETAKQLGASCLVTEHGWFLSGHTDGNNAAPAACIKLTSGSTGLPTPIPCTAEHLIADGRAVCRTMGIRPTDRNLGLIPFGHSYGLGNLVLPLILQGTSIFTAPDYMLTQIPEWIQAHRLTVWPTVPAILGAMARLRGASLNPLRLVISAGAPLSLETARVFHKTFDLKPHNFYGSSETGGICYDRTGTASLTGRAVGTPLHGVRVSIGKDKHIRVSGPAVAMPRGTHILADQGKRLPNGEITILGRSGKIANIGGKKVHPAEIESLLRKIPGVSDAWVDIARRGERDILIAAAETSRPEQEVAEALAAQLPEWKQPKRFKALEKFPRTTRGKTDTSALRQLLV